ncbi:MAG TPA: exo-alpha-sialidase, partial [Thermoanaerobaculia bacterium]|nr:exo-alpha-sialidase [Thermoanaerobaculia bacterium]
STNNGATWTLDGTFSGSQTNADKQIVWVDHSNTSAFKDNVYACWHNGLPQFVNRRVGSGGTWGTPLQISGAETTGTAIGCDVKTNSSGDVFVFWPATGNRRILMAKSTNGGVSYGTPVIVTTAFDSYDIGVPSFNNRRILIYATGGTYKTGTKDNVYVAWADLSGDSGCTTATNEPGSNASSTCKTRIWFSRSTNGGTTWSTPVKINNQAGLNDQYNPWMVVDETNGQLAIIYYDTVGDATRKKTHVYYQASFDDGSSWSTPLQVTTAQTDETIAGADLGNQYGDYNSLSGIAGTFFGSWTDRRSGGKEEIWTAAIQEGGTPCTPPAAPTGVSATASGANQINLSWSAVSGATEYRIFRATTSGGPYTQVGTSATTSFSDTGLTCNTTYYYVIRAFVGCESVNSAQVQATTASCPVCTTQTLYTNGFETPATGLAGFTTGTFVAGGNTADWRGVQACTAKTGTKIFRFGGSNCTANYGSGRFAFAQPNGAAGIAVPAGSTTTRLSFWHRSRFESGYDGGTVTVSVNGTNYFFVPGTALLSGTYTGTTSASCPPAGGGGVPVFTGVSTSFTNTVVDLDAACNLATGGTGGCAGQSVRVGFTSITDCSVTDDGWFLDDVAVTACVP